MEIKERKRKVLLDDLKGGSNISCSRRWKFKKGEGPRRCTRVKKEKK